MQEPTDPQSEQVNHFRKGITLQEYVRRSSEYSQPKHQSHQSNKKQNGKHFLNHAPDTPIFASQNPSIIQEQQYTSVISREPTPSTPLFEQKEIPQQTTKATFRADPLLDTTLSQQITPLRKTTYISHKQNIRIKNVSLTPAKREKTPPHLAIQGKAVRELPELMTFYGRSPKKVLMESKSKKLSPLKKLLEPLPMILNDKKHRVISNMGASILRFC